MEYGDAKDKARQAHLAQRQVNEISMFKKDPERSGEWNLLQKCPMDHQLVVERSFYD